MNTSKIKTVLKLGGVAMFALLAVACEENTEVTVPTFDVKADKAVVRVGERAVFNFEGDADIISFYSGDEGSDYDYKSTNRILPAEMYMSFTIMTSSGTAGYPNPARLPIYYSTDFSGDYTLEAVQSATWTEVTDLFKMPTDVGQQIPSGAVCMTDFFGESDHLYLAMFYQVDAYDASAAGGEGNGRTQWNVMSFTIEGQTQNEAGVLYEPATMGWQFVYEQGYYDEDGVQCESCSMPDINTSRVLFRSEYRPTVTHKVWCISGRIDKQDDVNLGFDRPTSIKSYADPSMTSYYHIYNTPGTYTATFIGVNASVYGREEVIRQVDVEVVYDGGAISQPDKEEWK